MQTTGGPAARRWRDALEAWAIPEPITAAVAHSPWTLPTEVFGRRADAAEPAGVSYERAAEALARPGSVLDVGAGAGAASLPLAPRATRLIAVDTTPAMLEAFAERAAGLIAAETIPGRWPDIADHVPVADVVVCHHVFYNAPDLGEFALALHRHARRRVVVELPEAHPMRPLNPLWRRLHGLDRPQGPTADDALSVLREVGISASAQRWPRPPRVEYPSFDELVAVTGRRLCLPPERADELATALIELGIDPAVPRDLAPEPDTVVTLWWDQEPDQGPDHGQRT